MSGVAEQLTPHPVYLVGRRGDAPGVLDISTLTERVYGKPLDGFWSTDADGELSVNSSRLYLLTDRNDYTRALRAADRKRVLLGSINGKKLYHDGHTPLEYWLSIEWSGDEGDTEATAERFPDYGTDLYGAVFQDSWAANSAYSPPMRLVLADLIRRREIPRGDYLYLTD